MIVKNLDAMKIMDLTGKQNVSVVTCDLLCVQ